MHSGSADNLPRGSGSRGHEEPPLGLDWIDAETLDAIAGVRVRMQSIRVGLSDPRSMRACAVRLPQQLAPAPTDHDTMQLVPAVPTVIERQPSPESIPAPEPVQPWEPTPHHAPVEAETPEQWLERMWGETGDYELEPEHVEAQLREAEASFVKEQNSNAWSMRLAVGAVRRPIRFLVAWVACVTALAVGGVLAGTEFARDFQLTSGESRVAAHRLHDGKFLLPASESIIVTSVNGLPMTNDRSVAITRWVIRRVDGLSEVNEVGLPAKVEADQLMLSKDGRSTVIPISLRGSSSDAYLRVGTIQKLVHELDRMQPGYEIKMIGAASAKHASIETSNRVSEASEVLTIPIIIMVLLLVLGSIRAAVIPVFLAITAVAGATGASALASHLMPASVLTSSVITLIGMAVGTDYTFFILRRVREEYRHGRSLDDAILVAASTSGRAIVVSGITVVAGLCGMFLSDTVEFSSIAMGSIFVVVLSVAGSIIALPAIIKLLGPKTARPSNNRILARIARDDTMQMRRTPWTVVARAVLRHPGLSIVLTSVVLLLLALPVKDMRTMMPGFLDVTWPSVPEVATYKHIQKTFPGEVDPAIVAVDLSTRDTAAVDDAVEQMRARAIASNLINEPIQADVSPDRSLLRIVVPLKGDGADAQSQRALRALRNDILPVTIGPVAEPHGIAVTGRTAEDQDFNDTMRARTPVVFLFVISVSFVILMLSFRSIVVPIKATVLNLMSVGATYGAIVLVFQHGWGAELINANVNDSVVAWLPLFLYVIMFGLSMDYHVFILSRVRELWLAGEDPDRAVVLGIGSTARTVTASAIVMIGVFSAFMAMPVLDMKQLGFGLTIAVALDAWVIRGILLPASMKLLGARNWYLPGWLQWLPELSSHGVSARLRATDSLTEHIPLALALDMGRISTPSTPQATTTPSASAGPEHDQQPWTLSDAA